MTEEFQDVFTSSLDGEVLMIVECSKLEGGNHLNNNTKSQILYGGKFWQALTLAKSAERILAGINFGKIGRKEFGKFLLGDFVLGTHITKPSHNVHS